jgi:transposase
VGGGPRAGAGQDHAQKKSLIATERDEAARAAWRADAAALDPQDLVFLDETATTIAMTPRYARAPRGERVCGAVPRNHGEHTTLIAALRPDGSGPTLALDGAADGAAFRAYLRACLLPTLRPGQIIVLDNRSVHKGDATRALVEAHGCRLLYLPAYSPDCTPIELAFAKLKEALRRIGARTKDALLDALASALDAITAQDARSWFAACGFPLPEAQPQREPL